MHRKTPNEYETLMRRVSLNMTIHLFGGQEHSILTHSFKTDNIKNNFLALLL